MLAKTLLLTFCGYNWSIAINDGHYECTTKFAEEQCKVEVECRTGQGHYDVHTKIVTAIAQKLELQCGKEEVQSARLIIYNEFAAAVSCQKE